MKNPLELQIVQRLEEISRGFHPTAHLGRASTTVYDAAEREQALVDALGNRTTFGYDATGQKTTVTNALGNLSTTVYDAAGRQEVIIDPLGNRTTFAYDADSQPITATNPLGNVTCVSQKCRAPSTPAYTTWQVWIWRTLTRQMSFDTGCTTLRRYTPEASRPSS